MKCYNYTREGVADLWIAISCLFCPFLMPPSPQDEIASFSLVVSRMRWYWELVRRGTVQVFIACNNLAIFILFDFINTCVSREHGEEGRGGEQRIVQQEPNDQHLHSPLPQLCRYVKCQDTPQPSDLPYNTHIYKGRGADGRRLYVMTCRCAWRTARELLKIWIFL